MQCTASASFIASDFVLADTSGRLSRNVFNFIIEKHYSYIESIPKKLVLVLTTKPLVAITTLKRVASERQSNSLSRLCFHKLFSQIYYKFWLAAVLANPKVLKASTGHAIAKIPLPKLCLQSEAMKVIPFKYTVNVQYG